jgi:hypothetical protein
MTSPHDSTLVSRLNWELVGNDSLSEMAHTNSRKAPQLVEFKEYFIPDIEEALNYSEYGFHPVRPGDVYYDGKYKVWRKLGYGSSSTTWLAEQTT